MGSFDGKNPDDIISSFLNEKICRDCKKSFIPVSIEDDLCDECKKKREDVLGDILGSLFGGIKPKENVTVFEADDATVFEGTVNDPVKEKSSNIDFNKGSMLLDTYRIDTDPIQGGMGSVWRVHHQNWDVDLAMKRPKKEYFVTENQKESFMRECESWINLGLHPNIVSCYYVREIDGVPTIFSEWMENGDLESHIQDESLYEGSEEEVQKRLLDIAIQFAFGLNYAHEKGLIHQEVKPSNLLLSNNWDAKVSDFGLANACSTLTILEGEWTVREDNPFATIFTPSGGSTPAYCSPEQAAAQLLTRRTDIYSWAVSILEMYLGSRPWAHGSEATGPMVGLACNEYFESCRVSMPEKLSEVLACCMASKPDDRYHDFQEVVTKLKDIYLEIANEEYPRTDPKSAADTSDNLNNRALSFIDLGKTQEAQEMLKHTIDKNSSSFLYHFNYALNRWNNHEISDKYLKEYLSSYCDNSDICKEKMNMLDQIRGIDNSATNFSITSSNSGKEEKLLQASNVSNDGRYKVTGFIRKEQYKDDIYGYKIEDLKTGEISEYINKYGDYGISTRRDGTNYMHPHYYKSDEVFFVGRDSDIVAMVADALWFFDSKSGNLICSLPPIVDDDGDTFPYEILGYTEKGEIEYKNWEQRRERYKSHTIHPRNDLKLNYELAGINTVESRLEAEKNMEENYKEALRCWEENDIKGTYNALKKSLDDNVLTMHEPSLQLWTKLSPYYKKGSLITVVVTDDSPSPIPERNKCKDNQHFCISEGFLNQTDNGQTELILEREEEQEYDICMDMYEYTFYYTLIANDKLSGKCYFMVKYLEVACEADWNIFTKDRYLGLEGESTLWYAKNEEEYKTIDLKNIVTETFKDDKSRLEFCLPSGYTLKNVKGGVDIGGFVFDDTFDDFRPLWNSDIIACRNHNYRLVYQYIDE